MKKIITLALSILFVFLLTACTNDTNNNQNPFVEIYKSKATEYIENGDTEAAIKALEEGVTTTGDEGLKTLLEELKNDNVSSNDEEANDSNSKIEHTENKYAKYIGNWVVKDSDMYFHTALTLKIEMEDTKMKLTLRYEYLPSNYDYANLSKTVAEISKTVDVSEITDDVLVLNYNEDGCGNSGKIKLSFATDFILAESDYFVQDHYFWGFLFNMSKFERDINS